MVLLLVCIGLNRSDLDGQFERVWVHVVVTVRRNGKLFWKQDLGKCRGTGWMEPPTGMFKLACLISQITNVWSLFGVTRFAIEC